MKLHINSGRHGITDPETRIQQTKGNLDSVDVVFVENGPSISSAQKLKALAVAPFFVLMIYFVVSCLWPLLGLLCRSDQEVVDEFIKNHDAKTIPVDLNKLQLINEKAKLWASSNWLFLLGTAFFTISYLGGLPGVQFLDAVNIGIPLLVLLYPIGALSLFFAFAAAIDSVRNDRIADMIENHAKDHDEACLVVGADHHKPVADRLSDSPEICVINMKPERIAYRQAIKAALWGRFT